MAKSTTVPVSVRAAMQRINRKLAPDGEKLLKCREGARWLSDLGRYYILDVNRNVLLTRHVALDALGRKLKVLAPWESLVEG
jgi:hypothetical protein